MAGRSRASLRSRSMGEPELALGLEAEPDFAEAELDVTSTRGPAHGGRLFSNAVVFVATAAFQRAVAFLLLPLTTRALGPDQYGQLSVALSVMLLSTVLFTLGFDYAIFRLYLARDAGQVRREQVVFSTWAGVGVAGGVGTLVLSAVAWLVVGPGWTVTWYDVALALLAAAFAAGTLLPLSVLRAETRVRAFAAVNLAIALATTVLILAFVVVFGWGPVGWLVATALASALGVAVAMKVVPLPPRHRFDFGIVRQAFAFGAPLLPHFASHWMLQMADRVVLATLVTDSQLGVYSLAGNFGLAAMIGVQGLNQAVMPTYARASHDEGERGSLVQLTVVQVLAVGVICAAVALLSPPVIHLVLPADFGGAARLVPWIALGYAFLGLYFIPMNEVSLMVGQTKWIWIGTASAATINIAALFIFVPAGGILAAAIASAGGYAVLPVWLLLYRRRHQLVRHDPMPIAKSIVAVAGVYFAAVATTGSTTVLDLVVRAAWLFLCTPAVLISLKVFSLGDARRAISAGRSLVSNAASGPA
jgi:O-antigen/teichoic acid export membrane protein